MILLRQSTVAVTLLLLKSGTTLILRAVDTSFSTQIQSELKGLKLNTSYLLHILVKQESAGLKKPGRQNCENTDKYFNLIESDLHNLYPSVGEVNNERQNFAFSDSIKKTSPFGQCQMLIDRKRQRVTPPERARGVIARAYLYMSMMYGIELDAEHVNLFNRWNKKYKPDQNECKRNLLIKEIQGNENPYISQKCKYGNDK